MTYTGLTSSEVLAIAKTAGTNSIPVGRSESFFQLVWRAFREPILLLLLCAGAINFFLSELSDAIFLMITVVIITGISVYQVKKSERAIAALSELTAPSSVVIRDGEEKVIPSSQLVPGDLLIVHEGQRVSADAQVLELTHLRVDESTLTGESLPKAKFVGDPIFSGTLVVKGYARAKVIKTGTDTQLGQIGSVLDEIQIERTKLQREIDVIVRYVAVGSLTAAVSVFLLYGFLRNGWLEAALAGIAAAMALIPEEFPIVLTVFLALGAWRLSKVNVITRHAPVIELLGTITVLCVDKTGTLTTNQMSLQSTEPEVGYYGRLACPLNPTDPMDRAFSESFKPESDLKLIHEYPLSDELLVVVQVWKNESDEYLVAAKGSPEHIARVCGFDSTQISTMMIRAQEMAEHGYRLLGVARATYEKEKSLPKIINDFDFEFLGLAKLRDPIRTNINESVIELNNAGVRTIMLTGDYSGTASAIANEIGLFSPGGVLTGADIDLLDENQLAERIKSVNVFARVVPAQKLRLVNALKRNGEIVGMTGDGVNDAPALSVADVGIAMGMRGTDVAREAADMVLTNDDFTSIALGIKQGRRIYGNLRKAMAYIVAIHIPIFGVALLPVFTSYWPLVLLPAQIALLEIVIDPAASVVFEAEQAERDVMKKPPRSTSERIFNQKTVVNAFIQGLLLLISALIVYFWAIQSGQSDAMVRSLTFATIMVGNFLLVISNRSSTLSVFTRESWHGNASVKWLTLGVIVLAGLIFNVNVFRDAFNLAQLSAVNWITVICIASLSILWFEIRKLIIQARVQDS